MEIKIRYTWKRKSDGEIVQKTEYIENLECGELLRVGVYMNPLYDLIARDLWTGCMDKNGNEIYGGDIVKERRHLEDGKDYIDVNYDVKFGKWCHCLYIADKQMGPLDSIKSRSLEIIGNIYSTPKL